MVGVAVRVVSGVAVAVGEGVALAVGVKLGTAVGVSLGKGVGVGLKVGVAVSVAVGVMATGEGVLVICVDVPFTTDVGGTGVAVAVGVAVKRLTATPPVGEGSVTPPELLAPLPSPDQRTKPKGEFQRANPMAKSRISKAIGKMRQAKR